MAFHNMTFLLVNVKHVNSDRPGLMARSRPLSLEPVATPSVIVAGQIGIARDASSAGIIVGQATDPRRRIQHDCTHDIEEQVVLGWFVNAASVPHPWLASRSLVEGSLRMKKPRAIPGLRVTALFVTASERGRF
jgi:hypothetical protein